MSMNMSPVDFVNLIRSGKNPQELMIAFLEKKVSDTPMGQNLLELAKQGNTQEIEKIARNITAQRGVDYDQAFNSFKKNLGL